MKASKALVSVERMEAAATVLSLARELCAIIRGTDENFDSQFKQEALLKFYI